MRLRAEPAGNHGKSAVFATPAMSYERQCLRIRLLVPETVHSDKPERQLRPSDSVSRMCLRRGPLVTCTQHEPGLATKKVYHCIEDYRSPFGRILVVDS